MVIIKDVDKMFWGLSLEPGRKYSQSVEQPFQVTMAALEIGPQIDEKSLVQVMLTYENSDYLLCTLSRSCFNQSLDLSFGKGEIVVFSLNGTGTVHLTGYNVPEQEEFADDYDDGDVDSDLQYDSEDEVPELELVDSDDEDDSDWEPSLSGKKRKAMESKDHSAKKMRIKEMDGNDKEVDSEEEEESDYDSSFIDDSPVAEEEGDNAYETESLDTSGQKTPTGKKKKKLSKSDTKNKEKKLPKDESKGLKPAENGAVADKGDQKKKKKKKKKKNKDQANNNQEVQQQSGNTEEAKADPETAPKVRQSSVGKPRKLAGGIIVEDVIVGHGPVAKPGRMVGVYYFGKLVKNGKQIDSNLKGKPFRFRLGHGEVIKGWDTGLIDMKCGGKRKITVPSSQAYGNERFGPIPAGSDLYFEVQLKSVG